MVCRDRTKFNKWRRANHAKHRDKINAYLREYRSKNRGVYRAGRKAWAKSLRGYFYVRIDVIKRQRAKTLGCTLTVEELLNLYDFQKGLCALSGRKLKLHSTTHHLDALSIDRKNPKKGYHIRNVRLVTYQANCAKFIGTDKQLIKFCQDVLKHRGLT